MVKTVGFLSRLNAALILAVAAAALLGAASPTPGPYRRMVALESSRSLGNGELALYLRSPDERVAARAALAIGRTKQPAGVPLLLAYLADRRDAVRAMSMYGLGLLATGADPAKLTDALADRSGAVRVAALDAIARYEAAHRFGAADAQAAQGALERTLAHDADPIVRARAAVALVEFANGARNAEAANALAAAFARDANLGVRRYAMWTIFRGYAQQVNRRVVEGALHDPDAIVRIEAVRAMARYKDATLVALVQPLLADPSWRVQEQAAETIRALKGQPATDHWKAIPSYVHLPKLRPDPWARLPVLAHGHAAGKPSRPRAAQAILAPHLDPKTARDMTGPAPGLHPRVRIVTTKGNVYVTLYPEWAPLTVANFLNLAARGYYNGNRWFRIVPDFVVQTGDPNDNGNGDAGYSIPAEENPLAQGSDIISMGLNYNDKTQTPIRDSAGTQYYITLSPQFHLDRDFTVFGAVTSGRNVLAHLIESDRVLRVERIPDQKL